MKIKEELRGDEDIMTSTLNSEPRPVTLREAMGAVRHDWLPITRNTLAAGVVATAVAFNLPCWYSSQALLLPPQDDGGALTTMVGAQLGGLAALAGGSDSPGERYVSILKSEKVMAQVVSATGLKQHYDKKRKEDVFDELLRHSTLSYGKKDGLIYITVEDRNPQLAARIANAYVEALSGTLAQANAQASGRDRSYLERRLTQARQDLAKAENDLAEFQKANKAVMVPEQAMATVTAIASLQAQIAQKEVEIAGLKKIFTSNAPEIRADEGALAGLRNKLSQLEGGRSSGSLHGVAALPDLGRQHMELMRNFKVREAVVEALVKQCESSALTEGRHDTSLRIIQQALAPERKSRPSRMAIIALATVGALLISTASVLVRHLSRRGHEA